MASGEHTAAIGLARSVAPALCRTLRWGAWRQVLALGRAATEAAGAAGDLVYFERAEAERKRALGAAAGTVLGILGGGSFLVGRGLATTKPVASGAKGCLLSPAVLAGAVAVTIATLMGLLGYNSGSPSAPVSGPEQPRAVELPTFGQPPTAATTSARTSPPPSTVPGRRTRPSLDTTTSHPAPVASSPAHPPSPSRPASRRTPTTPRTPRTPTTHAPPSPKNPPTTSPSPPRPPSVAGFWRRGRYRIEFPLDADDPTWNNIEVSYLQGDGTWIWLYDCWPDAPVSGTGLASVAMTCDIVTEGSPGRARVTHTPDDTVELVVDEHPEDSGTYHRI